MSRALSSQPPKVSPSESTPDKAVVATEEVELREAGARPLRWMWLVAGLLCVTLAVAGVALPLLPTTPFILVAAACFARGDERFLHWLLEHRVFGPTLRAWRARHALPPGVKPKAIAVVVLTIGLSAWMLDHPLGRVSALAMGVGLVVFLARLPEWDEREKDGPGGR